MSVKRGSTVDPKVVLLYGGAKGPVHINRVQCSGTEENLLECPNTKINNRGPGSNFGADFGVSCGELAKHVFQC